MYAVFEHTIHTDKGKAIVRAYEDSYDAQSVYRELAAYALQSTKLSIDAQEILGYISSTQVGTGSWKGTTLSFILHWQEQVHLYESMMPSSDHLSDGLKQTMLENAVSLIDDLHQVKSQADQIKAHTQKGLTYVQYSNLLRSAATTYDAKKSNTTRSGQV